GSSWVPPLITARYFSSCPSDSISRWTPCPPKYYKQWLQVRLGCIQLSPLCPFGRLHTFCFLRPARFYPRFRIWRSSFERQRDFNPPEQHAAQLALLSRETLSFSASCRFIPAHCNSDFATSLPVCVADDPLSSVVLGTAKRAISHNSAVLLLVKTTRVVRLTRVWEESRLFSSTKRHMHIHCVERAFRA